MVHPLEKIKALIEAMLFVSERPVTVNQMIHKIRRAVKMEQGGLNIDNESDDAVMSQLIDKQKELEADLSRDEVKKILAQIRDDLNREDHGIELVTVAKGYQLRTKAEISSYLKEDRKSPVVRLSPSAMESLAVIAYKQPVNRCQIEEIRGVDSGGVLKTLLDKDFIRIVGRSDEPGRPLVYGTTAKFLEIFDLESLRDLPDISEFQDLFASHASPEDEIAAGAYDEGQPYLSEEDFSDADESDLNESERAILDELDGSLKHLKDVEKEITFVEETNAEAPLLAEKEEPSS